MQWPGWIVEDETRFFRNQIHVCLPVGINASDISPVSHVSSDQEFDEYNSFLDCTDLELVRYLLRRQKPVDPLIIKVVDSIIAYHEKLLKGNVD